MKKPHDCADLTELHSQYLEKRVTPLELAKHDFECDAEDKIDVILSLAKTDENKLLKKAAKRFKKFLNGSQDINVFDAMVQDALTVLVAHPQSTYDIYDRNNLEGYAKEHIYKHWDQPMLDAAKLEKAAQGETFASEIKYNGILSTETNYFDNSFQRVKILAVLDSTTLFDTRITITFEEDSGFKNEQEKPVFVESSDKIIINIKKGEQPLAKHVYARNLSRHLKIKNAVIGLENTHFKLNLKGE